MCYVLECTKRLLFVLKVTEFLTVLTQKIFCGRRRDVVDQQTWFALRFLWIVGQWR